ncbi:histidinol dehydrogenase [Desulfovibrio litoralis]
MNEIKDFLTKLKNRGNPEQADGTKVEDTVKIILENVKKTGLDAIIEYSKKFDCPDFNLDKLIVSPKSLVKASNSIDKKDRDILSLAIEQVRDFHQKQKSESWFSSKPDGTILGQMLTPVDRAGLYAPGGQGGATPLISSVIMNAVPAQVAGVKELALCSPPRKDGTLNEYLLATAHLLGLEEVYACGSAWAIGALAYGAGSIKPVDVIVGPGNIFVATAKRLLLGTVGIDMIAGPSEICVLADKDANPAWIAADLLSQAEHDALASAILVSDSEKLLSAVAKELEKQLKTLPRVDLAQKSLADWSALIHLPKLAECIELVNMLAPEHLELMTADPWAILPQIRHAGAIFMGAYSSEALGDYMAGPNHVLPTLGTARFSSALSVETFCKRSSIICASKSFSQSLSPAVARLARLEGLEAHARSAECRLEGK